MSDTIALLPDGTQHPADGFGGTAANRFDDAVAERGRRVASATPPLPAR